MRNTKKIISLFLNLAVVIMECIALPMSFRRFGPNMFKFFTEDSNLLAGISCLIVSIYLVVSLVKGTELPKWVQLLKYIATGALTLTIITVVLVLAPAAASSKGGLGASELFYLTFDSNKFTHLLCPIFAIAAFLFVDEFHSSFRSVPVSAIPTLLYAITSTSMNIAKLWYGPYVFLRVYEQPVWLSVVCFFAIPGVSFLLNWALFALKKRIK